MRSNEDVMLVAVVSFIVQVFLSRADELQYSSKQVTKVVQVIHSFTHSILLLIFFLLLLLCFAMLCWPMCGCLRASAHARMLTPFQKDIVSLHCFFQSKQTIFRFVISSRAVRRHICYVLTGGYKDNNNNTKIKNKPNTNKFQFVRLHFKFCYHCWNGHCISAEGKEDTNVHNQRKRTEKKSENGNKKKGTK